MVDVMAHQLEVLEVQEMFDVIAGAGKKDIHAEHLSTLLQHSLA